MSTLYGSNLRPGRKGFTLIEVLVTTAIISLIVIMIYSSFAAVSASSAIMDEKTRLNHTARFIIQTLNNDLASAALLPNNKAGVFNGEDSIGDMQTDKIKFTGYGKKFSFHGPDQALIVWYVDETGKDNQNVLMRGESFTALKLSTASDEEGAIPVTTKLLSFDIKYLVANEWEESFDSTQSWQLPKAVKVTVKLSGQTGAVLESKSLIPIGGGE